MTDPQLTSQVLPPSTRIPSRSDEHDNTAIEYNNQIIALSDPDLYGSLEHNAFHFYQPKYLDGIHRGLNPNNARNKKFNLKNSARQALLEQANDIKNYVMGKNLSHEQRRLALFTSMGLPGMREMVQ